MQPSDLATRLLQLHAERPDTLFYGTGVLGSLFRDADLDRLDRAYEELHQGGWMEPSGSVISYFGAPKPIYRVTQKGAALVSRERVA